MHHRAFPHPIRPCSLAMIGIACLAMLVASSIPSWAIEAGFGASPSRLPLKQIAPTARPGIDRLDRIVVKFREGSQVRLRDGGLTSLEPATDVGSVRSWLSTHPGVTVVRHFSSPEAELDTARDAGERASGWQLADLNLYYRFMLPSNAQDPASILYMINALRALPIVETAFLEPIPRPATVTVPSPTLRTAPPPSQPDPATPDYTGMQGYLGASPSGVNAQAVWGYPGGRGGMVRLIDIEGGWLWSHEDLKVPFFTAGTPIDDLGWRNHGTAVMGEMVGSNNGTGVTGIASDLAVGGVSIGSMGVADAINTAASAEWSGDLFLIELHAPGPNANGSGQYGYVAMEFWQDNFDAIQTAVANGRICIEAAGNGEQNYDDAVYQGLFDRTVRNSGAIMVGAGTPNGNDAEWFTNYGSRLDLNGWGDSVVTTGYGDLQGGAETRWYTSGFSGTSSASPIVSGSVACLQGMCKATWGIALNGPLATKILYDSGSQWNGTKRIGRRPNLVAARALLLQGIGTISGTVRDAVTNQPIAGARVLLVEPNVLALTNAQGHYSVPVQSGAYTLRVSEFFHVTAEQTTSVSAGQAAVADFDLAPAPTGTIAGIVVGTDYLPLAGVTVRIPGTPIPSAQTAADGTYHITGIPIGAGYGAIYGHSPTRGAAWKSFDIVAEEITNRDAILPDAQTFESGNGGYAGDYPWQWGTPSVVGPSGAFSGTKCWGTNLTGDYVENTTAYLTTPILDPPASGGLTLSFTHYYDTESGFDGGNIQVNAGSGWVPVVPQGGYPSQFLSGLGNQDGWSGSSGGWQPVVVDLSAYAGHAIQIRFHFGSDSGVNGPGWYVDDVAIYGGPPVADVTNGVPDVPDARIFPVRPNPSVRDLDIRFRLSAPGANAHLRIVDAAGRVVAEPYNGPAAGGEQIVRWDGSDRSGRAVPAGIYYSVLEVDGKLIGRSTIVRVR